MMQTASISSLSSPFSDYDRWSNLDNLHSNWNRRTERIARYIPKQTTVIDLGAGSRYLEQCLDASCRYIPADLVDRGDGTVVCDLNGRPLPDFQGDRPDIVVLGGVLVYLTDAIGIVRWLSGQCSRCIISYNCVKSCPSTDSWVEEMALRNRWGCVNHFTETEVLDLLQIGGFEIVDGEIWRDRHLEEWIFVCQNHHN